MALTIVFITICIIAFIVLIWAQKKNGNYDERQEAIRNRGYKYGFFTMLFMGLMMLYLEMANIKLSNYLTLMIPMYSACIVTSIYDVVNQAFFRIKEKHAVGNGFLLVIVGIMESYFSFTSFQQQELTPAINFAMISSI